MKESTQERRDEEKATRRKGNTKKKRQEKRKQEKKETSRREKMQDGRMNWQKVWGKGRTVGAQNMCGWRGAGASSLNPRSPSYIGLRKRFCGASGRVSGS